MEGAGGDEQDVVAADHAVFGADGAALDQWQQVALHTFAAHIGAAGLLAFGNFVDFVDKDNAVLLRRFDRTGLQFFFVNELGGFFVLNLFIGGLHGEAAGLFAVAAHFGKHALQLAGHFFHAWGRHNLHADRRTADFDVDFFVVEFAFAQFFTEDLPGAAVALFLTLLAASGWQQGVQDALFSGVLSAVGHLLHGLFAVQLQRDVDEVANNGLNVAADITHFGKLGGLHFNEGRVGQFGQAAGNFGFTDTGWADH